MTPVLRVAATGILGLLVVACAAAMPPSATPIATGSTPTVSTTPVPTTEVTASPSLGPLPTSVTLDIRGSAREIAERIRLAPGPDGTIFVSVPHPDGSVIVRLDKSGPRPGWPIRIEDSTACPLMFPADDGSVRIVCDGTDLPRSDTDFSDVRLFAFAADGRLMAGWPVLLRPAFAGGMVGDELTILSARALEHVAPIGVVSREVRVTTISADGSISRGKNLPRVETCCGERWGVAPDGIAYGVFTVGERDLEGFAEVSQVTALDLSGERTGWPVNIDGIASGPAFGPDGRIVVTVGSYVERTSRVVVYDRGGKAVARSTEIPIAAAALLIRGVDGPYECGVPGPIPPIVAQDGSIFVTSEADNAIAALDPSLAMMPGWPYRPSTALEYRVAPRSGDLSCGTFAVPAVGPDTTLYLPLDAPGGEVGGTLAAVGPDGRVRPGWPVQLKRPGAEFWSVVVGSDGTVFALAVEPEARDTSSASLLAIAPDSTVLAITTILEPLGGE